MANVFYSLTIGSFIRSLRQLSTFLKQGEQWGVDNSVPASRLLEARLAPDMLQLPFQVHAACNTALLPLGGLAGDIPVKADGISFSDLHGYIATALEKLEAVKPEEFYSGTEPDGMKVHRLGKDWDVTPIPYTQAHALPNVYFHVTTAYLILRNQGVPVGKKDFLGSRDGIFRGPL